MTPHSPSKLAPWDLTYFFHSPLVVLSYFPDSHQWSEVSSLSKLISILGRSRSCKAPKLGCRGLNHLEDLMFHKKQLCTRCDVWVGALPWWSCQSPVAHSCSLLNHLNSFHGGNFKLNSKLDADLLLYSLSYFAYDGHTVHMLIQWYPLPPLTSTVKSSLFTHMHIPVHSPWLPGYIGVTQTILVMSTMAGLFLDRPRTSWKYPDKIK